MDCRQIRWALPIFFLALLVGCAGKQRLSGPNFPASGPPYIRANLLNDPAVLRPADLRYRMILIGDTGDPAAVEPSHEALRVWGDAEADRTSVFFLGDNLYFSGLEDDDRERGEGILRQQLDATDADKVFVPGNHDWGGLNPTRASVLYNQEEFIEAGGARFRPRGGCPGPAIVELAPGAAPDGRGAVVAILLDTQWWWVPEDKRSDCPGRNTPDEVMAALEEALAAHADDVVLVAAHHPLSSGSSHGGMSRGAAADLVEDAVISMGLYLQDLQDPTYQTMIERLSGPLRKHPPTVYAAGHDHALQILEGSGLADIQVGSGAGSEAKVSPVTHIPETIFAHAHTGFVLVDVLGPPDAPRVQLHVIEPGRQNPVFTWKIN